jgi:hypothetical protein
MLGETVTELFERHLPVHRLARCQERPFHSASNTGANVSPSNMRVGVHPAAEIRWSSSNLLKKADI